jgi:lysozyme
MPFNITAAKKSKYGENNMKISEEGKALIKKFEGCELESYRCSADVITIGFGHTKGVKEGDTCTQEEADQMLEEDLAEFEEYVDKYVEVDISQNQRDALISWTFNLGPQNLKTSTMLKELNAGNYSKVPFEMRRWNKAGGQTLEGLIRRREAESLLFEGKEWHEV